MIEKRLNNMSELSDKTRYDTVFETINKNNLLSQSVFKYIGLVNSHDNV